VAPPALEEEQAVSHYQAAQERAEQRDERRWYQILIGYLVRVRHLLCGYVYLIYMYFLFCRADCFLKDSPTPSSAQTTPSHAPTPTSSHGGPSSASNNAGGGGKSEGSKGGSSKNKKKSNTAASTPGAAKDESDADVDNGSSKPPAKRLKISYGRD
jgi:hypothetical protein